MESHEHDDLATEKISLRCPPTLKSQIAQAAKKEGRKPSQWIVFHLQQLLAAPIDEKQQERPGRSLESVETDSIPYREVKAK